MNNSASRAIMFEELTLECANLALTRAHKLSNRAGVAWVLQDASGKILHSNAVIAGADAGRLEADIRRFSASLHQLVLTIEPLPYLFQIAPLTRALNESRCQRLVVCYSIAEAQDSYWQNWVRGWTGQLVRLPFSVMSANLAAGPRTIFKRARPWVTAVSAADMYNGSKSIADFNEEFGFTAYISDWVNQSRALLYSPSQRAMLPLLDEENHIEEFHESFEVNDAVSCEAVFRHCVIEKRCSLVVLADMTLLCHLMERQMVDEVIHHVAVTIPTPDGIHPARIPLPMAEWTLQESAAVGSCSRLLLRSNSAIAEDRLLRQGLN